MLGVGVGSLLNLPYHIHTLDDAPERGESLTIGFRAPPKSSDA
jgi:hypothetical protein